MIESFSRAKVFGIGLNRTGTTTLGKCLKTLGYKHTSCNALTLLTCKCGDFNRLNTLVNSRDSFEDWPYPLFYKYLDEKFPGSKFILTTRKSPEIWLQSLKNLHLTIDYSNLWINLLVYGYLFPDNNPSAYIDFYNNHNNSVRNYFSDRPKDFIELSWDLGDEWGKLCKFLSKEKPGTNFPHINKSSRWSKKDLIMKEAVESNLKGILKSYSKTQIVADCGKGKNMTFNIKLTDTITELVKELEE